MGSVMMHILEEVKEFSIACGGLLNFMPVLTGYMAHTPPHEYQPGESRKRSTSIPEELETDVRMYLEHRGALDYKSPRQMQTALEINDELAGNAVTIVPEGAVVYQQ